MTQIDTIFHGGPIVTCDDKRPRAEAIAIRGDRIHAVGSEKEILALRSSNTELVNLSGVCLLPGLIEPHSHPDLCAQCYSWVDVSGFSHAHVDGVEEALRGAIEQAEPGEWIFAFGLDPMLTGEIGVWGRSRLDSLAPNNPVAVMIQSMHTLFVNSLAFERAGIDENTPDPAGGGRYQKDANGQLTGKVEETTAAISFLRFVEQSREKIVDRIWQQYRRYAQAGLTTVGMPGLFVPLPMISVFEELAEREASPIRLVAYLRHHQVAESGRHPGQGSDRFRVQGIKLWYDGSPYSGTMLLDEPYLESKLCCCTLGIAKGTKGHANHTADELEELILGLHREGWQVLTHAQGDRGTRESLDLYEKVLGRHHRPDHRFRLEHCALISQDDLARAQRLGVTPSFHVNHVYYYGPELRDEIIGSDRAERLMPIGSALAKGHRVSLHADSPMYPPEPFRLMRTAVTRMTRKGDVIAEHEAISSEQALRAITLDAAWQLFAEDRVGSLETGKLADLTLVDRNPLDIPPDEIDQLEVKGTWLSGNRITA